MSRTSCRPSSCATSPRRGSSDTAGRTLRRTSSALTRWLKLETAVRKLAYKYNEVFVITGPYYTDKKICSLPVTRIENRVPGGYWKIVAIKEDDRVKMAGFSFSQETARKEGFCEHSKNLEQIENISDLKFFGKKPDIKLDSLLREMGCR